MYPRALSLIVVSMQCQAEAKWRVNNSSWSENLVKAKEGLWMGPMGPVHRDLWLSEILGWEACRGLTPVRWTALVCVPVDVGTIRNKWRKWVICPWSLLCTNSAIWIYYYSIDVMYNCGMLLSLMHMMVSSEACQLSILIL